MKSTKHAIAGAIKEAFDNLPGGICFFDNNGFVVLCNRKMHAIAFEIMGRDIRLLSELTQALNNPYKNSTATKINGVFVLSNKTAWEITISEITADDNERYTQVFAADVTTLHHNSIELVNNNKKLNDIAERLRQISQNVAAIAREEEILAMKMRIHDELGENLLALRNYCQSGFPQNKKQELLNGFRNSARLLLNGAFAVDEHDSYKELYEIASSVGLSINKKGALPQNKEVAKLMTAAIRECVTNAVIHAKATEMYVNFANEENYYTLSVTNNGIPPKYDITEGGGLSSLRRITENAGGSMVINSVPGFKLTVKFPVYANERKENVL